MESIVMDKKLFWFSLPFEINWERVSHGGLFIVGRLLLHLRGRAWMPLKEIILYLVSVRSLFRRYSIRSENLGIFIFLCKYVKVQSLCFEGGLLDHLIMDCVMKRFRGNDLGFGDYLIVDSSEDGKKFYFLIENFYNLNHLELGVQFNGSVFSVGKNMGFFIRKEDRYLEVGQAALMHSNSSNHSSEIPIDQNTFIIAPISELVSCISHALALPHIVKVLFPGKLQRPNVPPSCFCPGLVESQVFSSAGFRLIINMDAHFLMINSLFALENSAFLQPFIIIFLLKKKSASVWLIHVICSVGEESADQNLLTSKKRKTDVTFVFEEPLGWNLQSIKVVLEYFVCDLNSSRNCGDVFVIEEVSGYDKWRLKVDGFQILVILQLAVIVNGSFAVDCSNPFQCNSDYVGTLVSLCLITLVTVDEALGGFSNSVDILVVQIIPYLLILICCSFLLRVGEKSSICPLANVAPSAMMNGIHGSNDGVLIPIALLTKNGETGPTVSELVLGINVAICKVIGISVSDIDMCNDKIKGKIISMIEFEFSLSIEDVTSKEIVIMNSSADSEIEAQCDEGQLAQMVGSIDVEVEAIQESFSLPFKWRIVGVITVDQVSEYLLAPPKKREADLGSMGKSAMEDTNEAVFMLSSFFRVLFDFDKGWIFLVTMVALKIISKINWISVRKSLCNKLMKSSCLEISCFVEIVGAHGELPQSL